MEEEGFKPVTYHGVVHVTEEEIVDVVVNEHVRRDLIGNPLQSNKAWNGQVEAIEVLFGPFNFGMIVMEAYEGDKGSLGSQIFGKLKYWIGVAKSGVR
ncbi:hypothetical protein SUGI_0067350 [Cryptomeria japonica]|nr:hypothetical protein SUGI_0067350 [Cryptomeria japonica]